MAHVIAGMTVSLDGFVADQTGSSEPLYRDLAALHGTAFMDAMIAETGAVLMGRRGRAGDGRRRRPGDHGRRRRERDPAADPCSLGRRACVDVVPVLFGSGLRHFDNLEPGQVELEKISVQEVGPRTSLRFRVRR